MTCSRKFGQLPRLSCLGLIGILTAVSCGGSDDDKKDTGVPTGGVDGSAATKANLTALPATANVGSVNVGATSTEATVTVTNNGTAAASVTATPSVAWIAASGCTGSLAVGASCALSITATPTTAGVIAGTVSVAAAGGNTITIGVTGTATLAGNFNLSPTTIALGPVAVGTTVQSTVVVTANAPLTGLTVGVQGPDLKVDSTSTCTGTLAAAAATCNVVVNFTSATVGSPTGDAVVVTQGGVSKSVPVSATVVTPAKLSATPAIASLAAAPGSTSSVSINVGNSGGLTTGAIGVAVTGTSFRVTSDNCSIVTLAPNATCTVVVTYQPSATVAASETGILTVTDKGTGASSATVTLTGVPKLPSTLTLTGNASLGSVSPGQTGTEVLYTVTNTSPTASGALTAAVDNPNVKISSNTCTAKGTLALNETCLIGLSLTSSGTTAQTVSATLTVTAVNATNPAVIAVTGTVVGGPALSASPTNISFGSIPVNQSSAVQTVTVTNVGATPTGTLAVNLSGTGAAQVATTANTCTGTLAPAGTCTIAVQYSPTETTALNGTITVTDGVASANIPIVGTGLAPSFIKVLPPTFPVAIVGYPATEQPITVTALASSVTDSGAITATITGTNAADFVITGGDCATTTTLQPSNSCAINVTFTPAAAGASAATLNVTSAKGGIYTLQLSGTALPLVEIESAGTVTAAVTTFTPTSIKPFDFDATTLNVPGEVKAFRAIVRGAASAAATTTTAAVVLATSTPPDYTNVTLSGSTVTPSTVNVCNAAALGLTAQTGVAIGTAPTGWTAGLVTAAAGFPQVNTQVWSCIFYVRFAPQTSKGTKTASLTLSGSAGGNDPESLTGVASGPLSLSPTTGDFGNVINGDASSTNPLTGSAIAVGSSESGVTDFVITNNGTGNQGPFTVSLAGTNAADFGIVSDGCTSAATLASGVTCTVRVAFAPTSLGAKTATLTVTAASGEVTNSATLTGNSTSTASKLTLTPTGTSAAPFDFGSVVQSVTSDWKTFTINNPGTALSGQLNYAVTGSFEIFAPASSSASYPAGACGAANQKQLDAGASCTIQVRFKPLNSAAVGVKTGSLTVTDTANSSNSPDAVNLKGTSTSQLTLAPNTIDFGSVATNATAVQALTLTNAGTTSLAIAVPSLASNLAIPLSITGTGTGACAATSSLSAGGSCVLTYQYQGQADGTVIGTIVSPATTPSLSISLTDTTLTNVTANLTVTGQSVTPAQLALYGFGDIANTNPDPISFGNVLVGGVSGGFTISFTNTGKVAAQGISATVTAGSDFTIAAESGAGACGSLPNGSLAAGAICTVTVQLSPTTSGGAASTKAANLTLAGSGGLASVIVPLSGLSHAATSTGFYAELVGAPNVTVATIGSTAVAAATPTKVYYVLHNNGTTGVPFDLQAYDGLSSGGVYSNTVGEFVVANEASPGATDPACPSTVPANSSCQFSVAFAPVAYGDLQTNVRRFRWATIVTGGTGTTTRIGGSQIASVVGQVQKPAKLSLTGTSTSTITVGTSTVDFGQIIEQSNASFTFTITNTGETATKGPVALTLSSTTSYAQVSATTCSTTASLPGAGTCTATVTVSGTAGLKDGITAQAKDALQASENSAVSYDLTVRIVQAAALTLTPSATTFGTTATPAGAVSATVLTITVQNGGDSDTTSNRQTSGVLSVSLSDATDFQVDTANSTCYSTTTAAYLTVAAGTTGRCLILVDFAPQSAGAKSTTVSVGANPGAATLQTVTLTGTALGSLSITPSGTAAAPTAFTTSQAFTVKNLSTTKATSLLRELLSNAAAFVITSDNCFGQELPAGDTCTVTVQFVGTSSTTTAQTATLTVSDGTANSSATAYLSVGGPS